MIDTVIKVHCKDERSTIGSLGGLYALAIAYQAGKDQEDFWPSINEAIQERFGGNGTKRGMNKLDRVKKRGWRLHDQVAEYQKKGEGQ